MSNFEIPETKPTIPPTSPGPNTKIAQQQQQQLQQQQQQEAQAQILWQCNL